MVRSRLAVVLFSTSLLTTACGSDEEKDPAGPVDEDGDGFNVDEDCDDQDATVYPGAPEDCDTKDNDCDGLVDLDDPDVINVASAWADSDLDGYGDPDRPTNFCASAPPDNIADNTDDCDDRDSSVNPDGNEVCDGADNDCDGLVDADDTEADAIPTWAPDADSDGYGDADAAFKACDNPGSGYAENARDCDDSTSSVHPDAAETCGDGIDSDCDGADGPDRFEGDADLSCGYVGWDFAADGLASGDLDGDGSPELALANPDDGVVLAADMLSADLDSITGAPTETGFGRSVAVGDANGDGTADLFVGEPAGSGQVVFLAGPITGEVDYGDAVVTPITFPGGRAGAAMAFTSDLGGDGDPDLFVGAPGTAGGAGAVAVWTDAADGSTSSMLQLETGFAGGSQAGSVVQPVGDIDGDGIVDLAIGAPGAGVVALVVEGLDGSSANGTVMLETSAEGTNFGAALAGGRDLDGDGLSDVIVGAPGFDGEGGSVFVFTTPSDVVSDADAYSRIDGPEADAAAGTALAAVGDIDGDGFVDLTVGAPATNSFAGRLEVVMGPVPTGVAATTNDVAFHLSGTAANDEAGGSTHAPGDINADGHADFIGGATGAGTTWLFLGAPLF